PHLDSTLTRRFWFWLWCECLLLPRRDLREGKELAKPLSSLGFPLSHDVSHAGTGKRRVVNKLTTCGKTSQRPISACGTPYLVRGLISTITSSCCNQQITGILCPVTTHRRGDPTMAGISITRHGFSEIQVVALPT